MIFYYCPILGFLLAAIAIREISLPRQAAQQGTAVSTAFTAASRVKRIGTVIAVRFYLDYDDYTRPP